MSFSKTFTQLYMERMALEQPPRVGTIGRTGAYRLPPRRGLLERPYGPGLAVVAPGLMIVALLTFAGWMIWGG